MLEPRQERIISRYKTLQSRKVMWFQRLYEFTSKQCDLCAQTGCACTDRICEHVEDHARKKGLEIPRTKHALRFIGCNGCVVPPHVRTTCTIYLCQAAQSKPGFDHDRYDRLKRICSKIEWKLMEIEDAHGELVARVPYNG